MHIGGHHIRKENCVTPSSRFSGKEAFRKFQTAVHRSYSPLWRLFVEFYTFPRRPHSFPSRSRVLVFVGKLQIQFCTKLGFLLTKLVPSSFRAIMTSFKKLSMTRNRRYANESLFCTGVLLFVILVSLFFVRV